MNIYASSELLALLLPALASDEGPPFARTKALRGCSEFEVEKYLQVLVRHN
jgi:hypothetical protein